MKKARHLHNSQKTLLIKNNGQTELVYNGSGDIIIVRGLLPDGNIGIVVDEIQPFTTAEIEDSTLYNRHVANLNSRISKQYPAL